jgi:indole-3-glycerol phosphate synthase
MVAKILDEILEHKKYEIQNARKKLSLANLYELIDSSRDDVRDFGGKLQRLSDSKEYALIAEIKKASPSKGLICADFDPQKLALAYQNGGAACLSVLTDERFFQGSGTHLKQARAAVSLPVLRKDFMLDPYQILESRTLGADCILLIMACLSQSQAEELESAAMELGMAVLIEVHNCDELKKGLTLHSPLVGINNRDLRDFTVDIKRTLTLRDNIPDTRCVISESGISSSEDLAFLAESEVYCFLVGESLMCKQDVQKATENFLKRS